MIRIEQGRAATPSAQVCLALARALQLSDEEQAHLMRLAGHHSDAGRIPRLIPGSVHRIMDQLSGHPLSVYDATWQLLHWNRLFAATFGDPSAVPAEHRNMLLLQFEGPPTRARYTPAEVGDVDLDSDTLTTQGSNLRVVVYTPRPGTDARTHGRTDARTHGAN